jgi:hypothetical protein
VLAFQKELSSLLGAEIDAIRDAILASTVLNVDETPVRCTQRPTAGDGLMEESKGTSFNIHVRTYSTADATLLTTNARKDIAGIIDDNILTQYTKPIVHDHDIKYYRFATGKQGECNTHIERYLKGISELTGHDWPDRMALLLLKMLGHKDRDIANLIGCMDADSLRRYSAEYDEIIGLGKSENEKLSAKSVLRKEEFNLLSRLEQFKENHLLFAYDYTVPFSNNAAERDFRWIKTQQKVSGCHRSFGGATSMMRVMSFILTLKKRDIPVLPALRDVFSHISVLAPG